MPARIFFSYASEDKYWVDAFQRSAGFANVGNVQVLDYAAEEVGYGDLAERLDERIESSAVVIAFVSSFYKEKKWTVAEWEGALTEAQRRRMIFVPIMLDAVAVDWWAQLRKEEKLGALSSDYAYVSFLDAGGRRLDVRPEDSLTNGKIARLALQIRQDLEKKISSSRGGGPGPQVAPRFSDGVDVVVLGHPKAALPQDITEHTNKLTESLKSCGIRFEVWRDGWLKKADARGKPGAASSAIFVQPVAESEAGDFASNPSVIGNYLDDVNYPNVMVALWLPKGFSDADFDAAVQKMAGSKQLYALRADPPEALAEWLQTLSDRDSSPDETKIQIKTIGISDDDNTGDLVGPVQIINQLKTEISSIASKFVDNPHPTPPPLEFWGNQFSGQLKKLRGNRTIIAIHDLDVTPGPDGSIQKQLQARFDEILEAVEKEQAARAEARKPPLNVFLAALLVRSASALPFNEYPYDGRYGQWRLLGFAPPGAVAAAAPLTANPDSLAVFKQKLYSWAHSVQ